MQLLARSRTAGLQAEHASTAAKALFTRSPDGEERSPSYHFAVSVFVVPGFADFACPVVCFFDFADFLDLYP